MVGHQLFESPAENAAHSKKHFICTCLQNSNSGDSLARLAIEWQEPSSAIKSRRARISRAFGALTSAPGLALNQPRLGLAHLSGSPVLLSAKSSWIQHHGNALNLGQENNIWQNFTSGLSPGRQVEPEHVCWFVCCDLHCGTRLMAHQHSEYAVFSIPDFDPNEYANAVLAGEPYPPQGKSKPARNTSFEPAVEDVSVAISKLNYSIDDVDKQLKNVVSPSSLMTLPENQRQPSVGHCASRRIVGSGGGCY